MTPKIGSHYDQRGFYIATVDGRETSIYGEDKAEVEAVAQELLPLVKEQFADADHNYGLAFYACGYDGQAQQRFCQQFKKITGGIKEGLDGKSIRSAENSGPQVERSA